MTRFRRLGHISLVLLGMAGTAWIATDVRAGDKPPASKNGQKPPPTVKSIPIIPIAPKFGVSEQALIDFYSHILDLDYVSIYKATPVGPQLAQVDGQLKADKDALKKEVIFGSEGTGLDSSPLKYEYMYNDNEKMTSLTRQGVTSYFFYFNDKLWKIYNLFNLKKDGDPGAPTFMGAAYQESAGLLAMRFGTKSNPIPGRLLHEDPAHFRIATEIDWVDENVHCRAVDRSSEGFVAVVYEDRPTSDRMALARAKLPTDQGAVDPLVANATRGGNASGDSNPNAADAYTGRPHASPPGGPPPVSSGAPPNKNR